MKTLTLLLALLILSSTAIAQGIQYQAVARDADGEIMADKPMTVLFSVYPAGSQNLLYEEEHDVKTGPFGQFTVVIGEGFVNSGNWSQVDWSAGPMELGIGLDAGNGFNDLGRTLLQSVPRSLYAERAASADMDLTDLKDVDIQNPTVGQVLMWNGSEWLAKDVPSGANYIAGDGIEIDGIKINNTGDLNPNDDIQTNTPADGDISGTFDNLIVKGLRGNPISSLNPLIGQYLKWNGSNWVPDSLDNFQIDFPWRESGSKLFYNNGFVGIGTTNPLSKFHLAGGDLTIEDNFPVLTLNGSAANKIISFQMNGAEQGSLIYSNGLGLRANAGGDYVTGSWVLDDDGNFGLGLSTPRRKLHVHFENNNGHTSQMLISQAGGGDAWMNFGLDGATHYAIGIDNSDGDKFKIGYNGNQPRGVGENTRLTINSVGRVGIGFTDPKVKLDVNGAVKIGTTTVTENGIIRWTGSDFQGRKNGQWVSLTKESYWQRNGSEISYTDGNVGINTTNPETTLDVNGNIRTQGELRTSKTGNANMVPIAYGNIGSDGSIKTGTGNFSVTRSSAGRYNITIDGENFYYLDYVVQITLLGQAGFSSYGSAGGKMTVSTWNMIGVPILADRDFSFVVYQP